MVQKELVFSIIAENDEILKILIKLYIYIKIKFYINYI